jgi:hypothetical protein
MHTLETTSFELTTNRIGQIRIRILDYELPMNVFGLLHAIKQGAQLQLNFRLGRLPKPSNVSTMNLVMCIQDVLQHNLSSANPWLTHVIVPYCEFLNQAQPVILIR